MATINPHTTRANGTVLTAAIYNADHQNHITNANALNAELITDTANIATHTTKIAAVETALNALVEHISFMILVPANQDYVFGLKMPFGGTINEVVSRDTAGTCTATFKIDGVNLGGTANAVSTSEQTQTHSSANVFVAGNDLSVTISANSGCLNASFTVKYTRDLLP